MLVEEYDRNAVFRTFKHLKPLNSLAEYNCDVSRVVADDANRRFQKVSNACDSEIATLEKQRMSLRTH